MLFDSGFKKNLLGLMQGGHHPLTILYRNSFSLAGRATCELLRNKKYGVR